MLTGTLLTIVKERAARSSLANGRVRRETFAGDSTMSADQIAVVPPQFSPPSIPNLNATIRFFPKRRNHVENFPCRGPVPGSFEQLISSHEDWHGL